jgi:SAM-dependent methyltransferase
VLDVGNGGAGLSAHLPGCVSIDVDPAASPDVAVDLEAGHLPFAADSFDAVVCTDVLEHLEELHAVFRELVRVTRRFAIVSLPNNWLPARRAMRFGGSGRLRNYGLPVDRPADRHRWFFGYTEAEQFIRGASARLGLRVRDLRPHFGLRHRVKAALLAPFVPHGRLCNLYASSLWAVLEKDASKPPSPTAPSL